MPAEAEGVIVVEASLPIPVESMGVPVVFEVGATSPVLPWLLGAGVFAPSFSVDISIPAETKGSYQFDHVIPFETLSEAKSPAATSSLFFWLGGFGASAPPFSVTHVLPCESLDLLEFTFSLHAENRPTPLIVGGFFDRILGIGIQAGVPVAIPVISTYELTIESLAQITTDILLPQSAEHGHARDLIFTVGSKRSHIFQIVLPDESLSPIDDTQTILLENLTGIEKQHTLPCETRGNVPIEAILSIPVESVTIQEVLTKVNIESSKEVSLNSVVGIDSLNGLHPTLQALVESLSDCSLLIFACSSESRGNTFVESDFGMPIESKNHLPVDSEIVAESMSLNDVLIEGPVEQLHHEPSIHRPSNRK